MNQNDIEAMIQRYTEAEMAVLDGKSVTFNGQQMTMGKRLVRTVLIFTESSDQLSRATDRVP
ncbi:hypothetical protein OSK68_26455, partial [Escherichia coli]|nr:hypothetical protein [Escherichia coli]